jgi:hypothetical protein
MPDLFTPLTVGALELPNRILMAPLTRARAGVIRTPNALMAEYYRQRASAGLILGEATSVDPMGVGYADTPGIWSEEQVDGWSSITEVVQVLKDLYEPEAFFGRVDDLYLTHKTPFFAGMHDYYRRYPWRRLGDIVKNLSRAVGLFTRLMRRVPDAALRREYRRRLACLLRERPDPHLIFLHTVKCAMHYHHCTKARQMAVGHSALVNSF